MRETVRKHAPCGSQAMANRGCSRLDDVRGDDDARPGQCRIRAGRCLRMARNNLRLTFAAAGSNLGVDRPMSRKHDHWAHGPESSGPWLLIPCSETGSHQDAAPTYSYCRGKASAPHHPSASQPDETDCMQDQVENVKHTGAHADLRVGCRLQLSKTRVPHTGIRDGVDTRIGGEVCLAEPGKQRLSPDEGRHDSRHAHLVSNSVLAERVQDLILAARTMACA